MQMNWDAIAAAGELLAALAVLVSILYLARQIRQSAAATVSDVNQGIAQSFQGINELLASSPDLADIMVRGAASRSALSPAEAMRFDSLLTNFFNIIENQRRQESTTGLLTHERDQELTTVLHKRLVIPGVLEWWVENTDDFSAEFVRWVESTRAAAQQGDEADVE